MKVIDGCAITSDSEIDHLKLSTKDLRTYIDFFEKARKDPKGVCADLEAFYHSHPDVPEIANLLNWVYLKLRQVRKAEKLIQETYEKHPGYLIAQINYADQCLRKNQPARVAEIFDHIFDLKTLYPERAFFHLAEFRGFMVLMGFYHLAIKQSDAAMKYLESARLIAPEHISVLLLEKKLMHKSIIKKLARFFRID